MTPTFGVRPIIEADSAALAALVARSPDGGRIAVSPVYHRPLFSVMQVRHPDSSGVLATGPGDDTGGAVGAAWLSRGSCRLGGDVVPYALLHSLVVDPDYRRRGIAAAMTRRLLDEVGDDVLVVAGIQAGNAASLANARTWAGAFAGRLLVCPTPMRRRPPLARPQVAIREVLPDELDELARGVNTFRDSYAVWCPQDADSLRSWLRETVDGNGVHHYSVAVDPSGRLVAGVGIEDEARLMSLRVQAMPPGVRLANAVLRVVPSDREMRNLAVRMPWFAPGYLDAARHLWQTLRWAWRDRGSSLVATIDARSPVRQLIHNPPWLPTTSLTLAVRSVRPLPDGLLDAPVG